MLKLTSVLLFVVMFTVVPLHAQTLPDTSQAQATQTNLQKVFSRETKKIKSDSLVFEAKKMDKLRRQTPRSNWTITEKTVFILTLIGIAALVFLVIKYGKDCIRYHNNCNPGDELCYCEEYEQEEQERRITR